MFLGCRLAKGLDLKRIMDYFTWVWRFSNKFIYDYLKEKLEIVKTIQEDPEMSSNSPEALEVYRAA